MIINNIYRVIVATSFSGSLIFPPSSPPPRGDPGNEVVKVVASFVCLPTVFAQPRSQMRDTGNEVFALVFPSAGDSHIRA